VSWESIATIALFWGTVDLSLLLAFHYLRQRADARGRGVHGSTDLLAR
jgi:hypothetical protein